MMGEGMSKFVWEGAEEVLEMKRFNGEEKEKERERERSERKREEKIKYWLCLNNRCSEGVARCLSLIWEQIHCRGTY
ncbi:unnamed protein product [Allacma fusca]|uniref:Uncharacterized protein n=1 Tax=Allacma fusca TaxID=39272 RepID=A0A8J2PKY3_9HEXA|nr:unnamed protein product [Allacma fusca]